MNKRLVKYLLKGIIALGTAGFLNGISIIILEDLRATAPSKAVTASTLVEKPFDGSANMPKMDLPGLNLLPGLVPAEDPATHILADQNAGNSEPKTDILPDALEKDVDGQEPTETTKNQLIVGAIPTALLATEEEAVAEKHKKNYQLPLIYTAHSGQNNGSNRDSTCTPEKDLITLSENDWSTKYENDGSYKSNSTRHNTPSDDEMLKQFVSMMEQENRNKNSNQSCTSSGPQGLGTGSSYKSPNSSYTGTGTSLPKPSSSTSTKDTDKKDAGNSSKAATTPENTASGLLPFVDEDQDDMDNPDKNTKKLKNKNKKKNQEVKDLKVEKKNQPPVDAKKTDGAPVISPAATEKKPGEQQPADTKDDENVPAIPAALQSVHQKFDQAIQREHTDDAAINKLEQELSSTAINWVTENRKNTLDASVQKELKKYKLFLELTCANIDNTIENLKKQEQSDQNRGMVFVFGHLKDLYQSILSAYDDGEKKIVPSEPEPGIVKQFMHDHPKITGLVGLAGLGGLLWAGKKIIEKIKPQA